MLTAVTGSAVAGNASSASRASDPGTLIVHPAADNIHRVSMAPGIVPVASGNNTVSISGVTVHGYSLRRGYNLVTGLGSVNGRYLVPELARSA